MNSFRSKLAVIFFLAPFSFCQLAIADSSLSNESFTNVQFVKNYDGDTITFNIPDAPAIVGKNMKIRVHGIDTPELKKNSCPAAQEKAKKAKELVHSLLNNAQIIHLHHIQRGKYFRILADIEFDGEDLATILLEQNLAVRYSGGKRDYNWCQESNSTIQVHHNRNTILPPKISGVYIWPPPPVQKQTQKNDSK